MPPLRFLLFLSVFYLSLVFNWSGALADLDADWGRKQECWTKKSGVCIKRTSALKCPFSGGSTWWKGCPRGYLCCIPPKKPEIHRRITSLTCGQRPHLDEGSNYRIVGGFKAKRGELPWQALLTYFDSPHCGASIISEDWAVTAAHCVSFYDFKDMFKVRTGVLGLTLGRTAQDLEIKEIIEHEKFNNPPFANDIALLRLKTPARFDNFTQPICLPRRKDQFKDFICTVSGWGWNGRQNAENLTALNLPTMSLDRCKKAPKSGQYIHESNLCGGFHSGERDACQGDSGGPLACRMNSGQWLLAGVVSWGEGCALEKEPAVFAKVTYFLDWIEKKTGLKWD